MHGYRQWGDDLPEKLNGMWAFAIADRDRKRIFISRDRFGKKPLYYSRQGDTFAFSSELTALCLHGCIGASMNDLGAMKYFAYGYVPAPNTLFERILKLPAGHNLVLDLSTLDVSVHKYWDFAIEPFENIPENAEEQWCEAIRERLEKAVERRLMSDVPLGVFLSGGMDSSAVSAFAARIAGRDRVETFSVGFEEKSFDESPYSGKVARMIGTRHNAETLSVRNASHMFDQILDRMDEPLGDGSILPTYLLCKATRKKSHGRSGR